MLNTSIFKVALKCIFVMIEILCINLHGNTYNLVKTIYSLNEFQNDTAHI
jgi:hypothetical protein